ncbi:MAG: DEAD/DEAH box helicase family protein [Lachnospiraceae bacterium]|nr:DEAD/DEAH box helicase family protein [Lachnospiraceae bacterium]
MSQNDRLLLEKGLPVLSRDERNKLRGQWQAQTWDEMLLSLHNYGKYIMLRPTGFGKTYTCACSCNIGYDEYVQEQAKMCANLCNLDSIKLNNGKVIKNKKLANIKNKKVIFVYISEILKNTFDEYNHETIKIDKDTGEKKVIPSLIKRDKNGNNRIIYETYTSVALHWSDPQYLKDTLDIKNVGLIIFDEVQRMGAIRTSQALEPALKVIEKLGIYYVGATATHERATGYDVIDKYFRYDWGDGRYTYCWGEHIYTLPDAIKSGLIIPPEYKYIIDSPKKLETYRKKIRHTSKSMLDEINTMDANNPERKVLINDIRQLQKAVIKNASKEIHDTMLNLYGCDESYTSNNEKLDNVDKGSIDCPDKLPKYMRFLVFTPGQDELKKASKAKTLDGAVTVFGNMVNKTYKDFEEAFGRYGYKIRTTIISSANSIEKDNVNVIDPTEEIEKRIRTKRKIYTEEEANKLFVKKDDMTIDLIFSINMLNVGYHVDSITGLIFKRWTASNQVYLQQLGRCLSSVSEIIPVVFDFVNAVDDRGIKAPLYTYNSLMQRVIENEDVTLDSKVTTNADGTLNTVDDAKKRSKKSNNTANKLILDNEGVVLPLDAQGNIVNPANINNLDANYIITDMGTVSIDKLLSRCNVYTERQISKKLFTDAYRIYSESININGKKIDARNAVNLYSALNTAIVNKDKKAASANTLSINMKAFVDYLRNNKCIVYVMYDALDEYIKASLNNNRRYKAISDEVNTLLAASKTATNDCGVTIRVVVHKTQLDDFKSNEKMKLVLEQKLFNHKEDLFYYD